MTYLDAAVLNLTERICQRIQIWTGRTNVWLAFQLTNLSIVVYFIWIAWLYVLSGDLAFRIFVALFCGGVFFILTRTLFRVSVEWSEAAAYRRVAKGLRNPRRIRDAQLRIAFLTLSVLLCIRCGSRTSPPPALRAAHRRLDRADDGRAVRASRATRCRHVPEKSGSGRGTSCRPFPLTCPPPTSQGLAGTAGRAGRAGKEGQPGSAVYLGTVPQSKWPDALLSFNTNVPRWPSGAIVTVPRPM